MLDPRGDRQNEISALGARVRRARIRRGETQAEIAERAGVSDTMVSRMERGLGGGITLEHWLAVAAAMDLDLLADDAREPAFDAAIASLATNGAWARGGRIGDARWYDREPRPARWLPRSLLPAERMLVLVVTALSDLGYEWDRLARATQRLRQDGPIGRQVAGVLVITSTPTNRRTAGRDGRRSDLPWLRAFRDPIARMPDRQGLVWLARRGTHLLPDG